MTLFGLLKLGWNWLKTLFWLNCCERKTLFRLKKEAEQAEYGVSRTGRGCERLDCRPPSGIRLPSTNKTEDGRKDGTLQDGIEEAQEEHGLCWQYGRLKIVAFLPSSPLIDPARKKKVRQKKNKMRDILTRKRIRTGSIVVCREPWPSPS